MPDTLPDLRVKKKGLAQFWTFPTKICLAINLAAYIDTSNHLFLLLMTEFHDSFREQGASLWH